MIENKINRGVVVEYLFYIIFLIIYCLIGILVAIKFNIKRRNFIDTLEEGLFIMIFWLPIIAIGVFIEKR